LYQRASNTYHSDDETPENYLGPMNVKCNFCQALHFKSEKPRANQFSSCCSKGKVILSPLTEPNDLYKSLFTGNNSASEHFLQNIRNYNSALAFASMSATFDPNMNSQGPYFFKVCGQIYHYVSETARSSSNAPSYSQLYMLDSQEATYQRTNNKINSNCKKEVKDNILF
jgi:virulence-associated protein VagC